MTTERQTWFWIIGFVLLSVALYALSAVLLPFVAGMAVAYFLDPAADKLEKWGCSRTLATSIITGLFFIIVILLVLLIVPVLQQQIVDFAGRVPSYLDAIQGLLISVFEKMQDRVSAEDLENLRSAAAQYVGQALRWVGTVLSGVWSGGVAVFNLLSLLFITPVVCFYLLRDWDLMVAKVDGWLPRRQADAIREQARLIDEILAGFVRGQGLVCLILGAFYGIALSVAGLDFGLIVGLGAGLISFIPYVGSLVGLVVSVGLALAQFDQWQDVAIIAGIFAFGQVVEGNFLSPKLVGDRVNLHPVWIIFALLAGASLLGFVGVLLAVPVTAVIGVLSRFAVQRYLESPLYHGPTRRRRGSKSNPESSP